MEKIGFIGLGIMGKPMAKNLVNAGHPLVVLTRHAAAGSEIGGEVHLVETPRDVAAEAETIITMLPDGAEVAEVVAGPNGLLESVRKGTLVIDMSSISPVVTRRLADQLREKGAEMLDAPVSGGETGAIEGTLAIMVGGSEAMFERAKPILEKMGKSIVRVGEVGSGQTAKLANQILVAAHIWAVGEAFTLAVKAGARPEVVFDAVRGGLAGSRMMEAKMPLILKRNFQPGFKIGLHRKDLKNATEAAREFGIALPVTGMILEHMNAMVGEGKGDLDHGAIVHVLEKLNNVEIR